MSEIRPGDVILFVRPTLVQALRKGWRYLPAWLAGVLTAFFQRLLCGAPQGHYDGFQSYTHVGIAVQWQGALHLLESVPGPGVHLLPLVGVLASAPWPVHVLPLSDEYRPLFDEPRVCQWLDKHLSDRYRWGGLPFAVLSAWLGHDAPGAQFCSEVVMRLLQRLGIVWHYLPVVRWGRVVEGELRPQAYAPCEVAQLDQYARAKLWRAA